MRILSEDEKERISVSIDPFMSKGSVEAVCIYGSQVAGYARPDSDYDLIIVLRKFPQRIKYYYLKGASDCSALVVDSKSFVRDCRNSSMGEFVAGRMLNPYSALVGGDLMLENEIVYKKRVIVEGLIDSYADNHEFASEITYPLSYFLFEKLKKRAAIYPPVVYSYSQTYSDVLMKDNLEATLHGFRRAAEQLEEEGLVDVQKDGDSIRISPRHFRGGITTKLGAAASYTSKSLKQYAVHGYAGRVRPSVLGKEVLSKLARSRQHVRLPEAIRVPKASWSIPTGVLYVDSEDWLSSLINQLELDPNTCKIQEKSLGEIYSSASFFTFDDGKKRIAIAVKKYRDTRGMKWSILNLWSLRSANFSANPMERMHREYNSSRALAKLGIKTPEVVSVFLSQRMIATKFIQGKNLSKVQTEFIEEETNDLSPFEKFGAILATLHNNEFCMGDSKPSNAILCDSDNEIYLVDLEQAQWKGNPVWDIAEFIYYSVRFTLKEERARMLVNSFIRGYLTKTRDKSLIEKTVSLKYRAPFQAFIAPNILAAIRNDLKKIVASQEVR